MTLKEKFVQVDRSSVLRTTLAEKCEKIAEDFAIEFVVWLDKNKKGIRKKVLVEELLEMFKEDKALQATLQVKK